MTPRLSVIASAIRRVISGAANAVSSLDPYWGKVVSLIHGDSNVDKDDPYWNHVALLIHGNGTNGSTVITDQKGKTVTANGNAQISTAKSRFKGSAIAFDGSGDYLSIPASADFNFSTGDFTIEAWIYIAANSALDGGSKRTATIFSVNSNTSAFNCLFTITGDSSTTGTGLTLYSTSNGAKSAVQSISQGEWHHVAVSRSGTSMYFFLDGVQIGATITDSSSWGSSSNSAYVGGNAFDANYNNYLNGYIADVRITKGVARYTTTFNVPTSPFPNQLPTTYDPFAANTVLAMHMDGVNGSTTFYDQCGKTVMPSGNAQISTTQSKFGGSSAYFDGTVDCVSVPVSEDWNFGTGDFTVEMYAYFLAHTSVMELVGNYKGSTTGWGLQRRSDTNTLSFHHGDTSLVSASWIPSDGVWYHIAVSRASNVLRLFVGGTQIGADTANSTNISGSTNPLLVGNLYLTGSYVQGFNGYIDDLRITKGVARYTTTFTPPTKQFIDPVNDVLGHKPIPYGNATLGSGGVFNQCMQFDGTGDYYVIPSHTDFDFGSQDFTIEFWFKTAQTTAYACMLNRELVGPPYSGGFSVFANNGTSGPLAVWWADYSAGLAFLTASTNTHQDNQWHHFAWVRNGNTHYMFLDGVVVATNTSSVSFSSVTKRLAIGTDLTYGGRDFNGYIDELRISKGVARYTTTFSLQNLPHPNSYVEADPFLANVVMHVPMMSPTDKYWDNTSLLIPGNGANASTSIFEARGKTVTANGNAQVSTTQSKFNGSSLYFDGNEDYLSLPVDSDFTFGTGDFTVECWVKPTVATYAPLVATRNDASTLNPILYLWNTGVAVWYYNAAARITGTTNLVNSTWNHIAVCRSDGITKLFVNGLQEGSSYTDTNNYASSGLFVGGNLAGHQYLTGYLNDIRITKGVARYTTTFTPPAKSFLAFEDKKANALTYVGDAKLSRAQKKFTQISGYFNGTSSHVKTVSNVAANISGQDITIEGWIYLADVVGEKCICGYNNTSSSDFWDLRVSTAALKFRSRASSTDTSVSGGTLVATTWTHVAVVKSGTKVTLYVDGVNVATSSTLAIPNIATAQIGIGANLYGGSYWDYFNGHMQDLRITQAARYLSNFAVPAMPLPMV